MFALPNFLEELFLHPLLLPLLLFATIFWKRLSSSLSTRKNLPPSPPRLPIIGNLHQLSSLHHRSFLRLSQRYGELMLLHMGSKPTLVVSSTDAVREIIKDHDMIFCNRPASRVADRIFYDAKDVAFAQYGEHWKQGRAICVTQLLSTKKVRSFRAIREEETTLMVKKIHQQLSFSAVNLSEIATTITHEVICRSAFGWKYNSNRERGFRFKDLLKEATVLIGISGLKELIPCRSLLDRMTGLNGRVEMVAKELDEFLQKLVEECQHRLSNKSHINVKPDEGKNANNFAEILLEYQKENKDSLTTDSMKAIILDMFIAGTDTASAAIEWTMSELIKHPKFMKKVQEEVRKLNKRKGQRVCEDDLDKLVYSKAVIKESLRLHPPGPLLLFREALSDVKLNGFDIAAGTQVIINAWAINRDPTYWEEPEEFRPERFLNTTSYDFKGQDYHYIPFGKGRRMCPGISYSMVLVELVIANLVCEFYWKLPAEADCETLDMEEGLGVTCHRRFPLMVIATPNEKKDMDESHET